MPSTPIAIISSKNCRIRRGDAPSKSVVFVVTRKPRPSAALIPSVDRRDPDRTPEEVLAEPVHVDAEGQVLRGREQAELFLEEDGIRAEIDVLPALHQLGHEPVDVGIHQWLAARNAHHRGTALLYSLDALLHGEVLLEYLGGVLDLAAARAGEVAAEERLEHEDERIPLSSSELLLDHIGSDRQHLRHRNAHERPLPPADA